MLLKNFKLRISLFTAFCAAVLICFVTNKAEACDAERCIIKLRPKLDEIACAAPGAPLIAADEVCTRPVLIIPFNQEAGAVRLEAGIYPFKKQDLNSKSFHPAAYGGIFKISTCPLCDPLKEVVTVNDAKLCVKSVLNVLSCAEDGAVSFKLGSEQYTAENVPIPTLYYHGREGSLLHFAAGLSCAQKEPLITYDLKESAILRFKDMRFEVLKADNQGICYRRLL